MFLEGSTGNQAPNYLWSEAKYLATSDSELNVNSLEILSILWHHNAVETRGWLVMECWDTYIAGLPVVKINRDIFWTDFDDIHR